MIKEILYVGIGSFCGGIVRYLVSVAMRGVSTSFPWATMTVNILGCLLLGILWAVLNRCCPLSQWNQILITGFCGGFTTFSAFSKDSLTLLQTGSYTSFVPYALGSVILGILAVFVGFSLAK